MVSWDMLVEFAGLTPTVWELAALQEKYNFTNIESMEERKRTAIGDNKFSSVWYLIVNSRSDKVWIEDYMKENPVKCLFRYEIERKLSENVNKAFGISERGEDNG